MNPNPRIILLREGETLSAKAAVLATEGVTMAGIDAITDWILNASHPPLIGPMVIADPMATPRVYGDGCPIFHVPACAIDSKGRIFCNGAVDCDVPMWAASAGGQLAILGIYSDSE